MYIFLPEKKYYPIYQPYMNEHTTQCLKKSHSFIDTLTKIKKLGAKVYHIDQSSFAKISQLTGKAKIRFLESFCHDGHKSKYS